MMLAPLARKLFDTYMTRDGGSQEPDHDNPEEAGRQAKKDWSRPGVEPTLDELMNDPVTHAIMRYDHVSAEQVENLVWQMRWKLAAAKAKHVGRRSSTRRGGPQARLGSHLRTFSLAPESRLDAGERNNLRALGT